MHNRRRIHKLNILEKVPDLFNVCTVFILPLELQTGFVERSFILVGRCRGAGRRDSGGGPTLLQG